MNYIPNTGSMPLKQAAPKYQHYQTYLDFEKRAEKKPTVSDRPLAKPTTAQAARDQIESRYTTYQIRQHYARHLAGLGLKAKADAIPMEHLKAAFKEPDIEKICDILASVWDEFKAK